MFKFSKKRSHEASVEAYITCICGCSITPCDCTCTCTCGNDSLSTSGFTSDYNSSRARPYAASTEGVTVRDKRF